MGRLRSSVYLYINRHYRIQVNHYTVDAVLTFPFSPLTTHSCYSKFYFIRRVRVVREWHVMMVYVYLVKVGPLAFLGFKFQCFKTHFQNVQHWHSQVIKSVGNGLLQFLILFSFALQPFLLLCLPRYFHIKLVETCTNKESAVWSYYTTVVPMRTIYKKMFPFSNNLTTSWHRQCALFFFVTLT